jgi:hypothetical protein
MKTTISQARKMVGSTVFHMGEDGLIVNVCPFTSTRSQPMLVVMFGSRKAILKPSEIRS